MKFLDTLARRLGFVRAPKQRHFHAAAANRLTSDWQSLSSPIDGQLRYALEPLRNRSRELIQNNAYANKFVHMLKSNVLGCDGLKLRNRAAEEPQWTDGKWQPGKVDEYANGIIERQWREWGKREFCTVDKRLSWPEVQNLLLESWATDGECILRLYRGYPNKYGFAVQIIDADLLDTKKNGVHDNGNEIRMGVELSPAGEPVAYWLHTKNPYEHHFGDASTREWERVPAIDIVHAYHFRRAFQHRGYPLLAPVMMSLKMLGGYEEAELVAARTAASKMAFLRNTGEGAYQGAEDQGGNRQMEAEPGVIEELPSNMELEILDWKHPNTNFHVFVKGMLRSIAAGVNVSYNTLANDLEGVNFSSGRMGQMEERENWRYLQGWFAGSVCAPVFKQWLFAGLFSGAVPLPAGKFEKFNKPQWHGRRWAWVDPQKEVSAIQNELELKITSLSRVLAERNIDRDELLEEIASDKAALDKYGLTEADVMQEMAPKEDDEGKA